MPHLQDVLFFNNLLKAQTVCGGSSFQSLEVLILKVTSLFLGRSCGEETHFQSYFKLKASFYRILILLFQ